MPHYLLIFYSRIMEVRKSWLPLSFPDVKQFMACALTHKEGAGTESRDLGTGSA